MKVTSYSFSKVNFYLEITGKRDDGFHNLHTYFVPLNWYDVITVTTNNTGDVTFKSDDSFLNDIPFDSLSINKALKLLIPYKNNNVGFNIFLKKNVPYGAGLGIASSNAVSTFKVVNEIWGCNLPNQKLIELANTIGSDCAFFFENEIAFCNGRGDVLTSLCKKPFKYPLWVLKPKAISLNTVEGFKKVAQIKAYSNNITEQKKIHDFFIHNDYKNLPSFIFNTFFDVLEKEIPLFTKVKTFILEHGLKGGLSGSGASFFIVFENKEKEYEILQEYGESLYKIFDFYKTIL